MSDAGYLTIGKVVSKLQGQYPELSVSKVRYLEDEGLLTPSRTPGGYRLYSQRDVKRLETILYLQKTRFLPLAVIKDELERGDSGQPLSSSSIEGASAIALSVADDETRNKLHPIESMPDLLGVSVSFVRELNKEGIIQTTRSKKGLDLVDGRDFHLIRACEELRRFGFTPRVLSQQYVRAANRESTTFEQALSTFARRGGGAEPTDKQRDQFNSAFSQMLALTTLVRESLVTRHIRQAFKEMDPALNAPKQDEGNNGID